VANPFNLRDERGRSDWDRRHAFVASWLWSPQWKSSSKALNGVLSGWTFTGITTAQSGGPLTFVMGSDVALDGTGAGGKQHACWRPIRPGQHCPRSSLALGVHQQLLQYLGVRATAAGAAGIYGNAGRG